MCSAAVAAPASFDRRQLLYASYVLVVLTIVYLFNFIDRPLPSILAERIKDSLSVSDAEPVSYTHLTLPTTYAA